MIDAAKQGHVFALEIMIPYLKRSDSAMATEFTYMLAEKGNTDLIKDIIKKNGDVSANSSPRYVRFLQSDRVKKHDVAMFQIARMLIDEEIANKFDMRYSPEDGVKMLHKIEKTKEHGLKKRVHLALGEAYRTGKGAERSMWMAAQYYEKYDPALAKECLSKNYEEKGSQQAYKLREMKGMEWLKKYPCPELERKLALNSTKAKNIILQYGECADKITEQEIVERDRLLKLGFSIEELYDQNGFFNAWKMQKQIEKRQAASDTAELIENVKSFDTSIQSVKHEQAATTEGTVNIVFYSDFKEDPRTTSRDWYTPIREENDVQRSILKRERERLNKPDMATKILFAVECVVINGEQVNNEVFFDHLTLTLKPGIYNIQVRCYCKYYFAGWHPADGLEIDRWPDYKPKDVAKNVRKTLEMTVEVEPGKTHYLGYFVRMYGEWEDYYNLIGLFNHKYLKKVDVNFSFDKFESEKDLLRKVNSYSIRGGFITLEDIGKPEYSIPEFMV